LDHKIYNPLKHSILMHLRLIMPFAALLVLISCNKKPEQIGLGIIPDVDQANLFFTDTISITAYSLREDSIRTDESSNNLLGSINDPVFGTSVAGFYAQFALSTNGHNFGLNPQLDSLVLQLAYSGYYGDTTTPQRIRVYDINEQLFYDSSYYSRRLTPYDPTDYADFELAMKPVSPFIFGEDTLVPSFRIRLSDLSPGLGEKILQASEENLESTANFQEYFKGIFVTADPVASGGAIAYLNLPSNLSRMTIYYHNDEQDSLRYELFLTGSTARYNYFSHQDYMNASPEFRQQVVEGDTSLGKTNFYVQAMDGVKTFVRFPNLGTFAATMGKKVVVNEAKLIFQGSASNDGFNPPSQLALVAGSENLGKYRVLADQLEGDNYFGGSYKKSVNAYEFRLTRLIQDMILDGGTQPDYGLYVFVSGASGIADRMVFSGTQAEADTLKPFRLQLIYSLVE
jgi:hypothetical protein